MRSNINQWKHSLPGFDWNNFADLEWVGVGKGMDMERKHATALMIDIVEPQDLECHTRMILMYSNKSITTGTTALVVGMMVLIRKATTIFEILCAKQILIVMLTSRAYAHLLLGESCRAHKSL